MHELERSQWWSRERVEDLQLERLKRFLVAAGVNVPYYHELFRTAGFDPTTLAHSEGLGLAGIREQAEILGGTFELRSAPGSGTELRVWWPVQDVAEVP